MSSDGRDPQRLRFEPVAPQAKPLFASIEGFSLHAAQSVASEDREALERLLRYGLRAPFSQGRLSRQPDGKVVYRLRRPWPNGQGATHLILDPLDFLRRLATLVSFPHSHQVRYHGVFANRRRLRPLLPPPPPRPEDPVIEDAAPSGMGIATGNDAPKGTLPLSPAVEATTQTSPPSRRRVPWAQLLRRLLHIDALACPRCSTRRQSVPMVVLAFLTDPDVVGRILRHLGLPTTAPALAPARPSPDQPFLVQELAPFSSPALGWIVTEGDGAAYCGQEDVCLDPAALRPIIRPPP